MLDVKVETLKEAIQKKIVDLSIPYDDQRKLIKYLQILDPESDPTWCITIYYRSKILIV